MQITLVVIGKLKNRALKELYDEYKKRIEWKVILHEFEGKSSPSLESAFVLKSLPPSSFIIALDERGEDLRSEEFAALLKDIQLHHHGRITLIIGGAEGLSNDVKNKAQKIISYGRMTWPHLLVRIMLMEQLYRAQQILKGHPYHRE